MWAECNIRAAWILGVVCREGRFGGLVQDRQLRALEAALFMIGYELPWWSPARAMQTTVGNHPLATAGVIAVDSMFFGETVATGGRGWA